MAEEKNLKQIVWDWQAPESIWHIGEMCLSSRRIECEIDKVCKNTIHIDKKEWERIGRERYKFCKRYTMELKIKQEDK